MLQKKVRKFGVRVMDWTLSDDGNVKRANFVRSADVILEICIDTFPIVELAFAKGLTTDSNLSYVVHTI